MFIMIIYEASIKKEMEKLRAESSRPRTFAVKRGVGVKIDGGGTNNK